MKLGSSLLTTTSVNGEQQKTDELPKFESKQEKKERAVKEREEKVRLERERVEASTRKSRMDLNKEEGEREFKCVIINFYVFIFNNSTSITALYSQTRSVIHRYGDFTI